MITSIINAAATVLTPKPKPAGQQVSSMPQQMQKTDNQPVRRKCKRDWLDDAMQCEEHAAPA